MTEMTASILAMAHMCRTCESETELISLSDAESKSIVKKLRACADISIEVDDALPKFICANCSRNLEFAYTFKIQCEYTDRKFREAISFGSVQNTTIEKIEIDDGSLDEQQHDEFYSVDHLIEVDHGDDGNVYEENINEEIMYLDSIDTNTNDRTEDDDISQANAEGQSENEEMSEVKSNEMFWGFDDQSNASSQRHLQSPANDVRDECDEKMNEDINESAVSSTTTIAPMASKRKRLISKSKSNGLRGKRPFQCDTCEETFEVYAKLNEHKKSHGKERYQCPTCERWFQKRYHMKNHEKIHKGLKSYECQLCQKRYTNQTNLDRHIRVTHQNEKKHTCQECGKSFSQLAILRQHHAVHMTERNFHCDVCEKTFKLKQHLRLHQMRHLPQPERPKRKYKPPKKKYKPKMKSCVCTECGKHSNTMALHLSHMKTHSGERPYECRFCKKSFSFQQSLRNHIFLHTGEKPHKCDVCGMAFRQIGHLQGHKLVHSGLKPHYCVICNKSFALRSNLTVHMRLHTGETPYHCNICPKKFYDSNGLRKHRLVHQRKNDVETNVEQPLKLITKSMVSNNSITDILSDSKAHDVVAQALSTLGSSVIISNDVDGTQYEVELPTNCSDGSMIYTIQ